jgi:hypothetical protein
MSLVMTSGVMAYGSERLTLLEYILEIVHVSKIGSDQFRIAVRGNL